MDTDLRAYVADHSDVDDVYRTIAERTRQLAARSDAGVPGALSPIAARLLTVLTRIRGARRAIEVGTFTGTSSVAIARGLTADGSLLCLDVSTEWTDLARAAWAEAGVGDRIELRIGDALPALRALPDEPDFDLALVDADKPRYPDYLAELVPRLRPGGVVLADNGLWGGRVIDPDVTDADTEGIRRYNAAVRDDPRLDGVLLPLGDGISMAVRTDA